MHQRLSIGSFRSARNECKNIVRSVAAIAALMACTAGAARAAGTFYVDRLDPNAVDSPSSGTLAKPYRTISAADHYRGGPGTTIIVKSGVYREQVTVDWSGNSSQPYVIQAADSTVVIDGANDFGNPGLWTQGPGTTWVASSVLWSPFQVFESDTVRLANSSSPPESLAVNSFTYVFGEGLYVNLGGDNPGNHQLKVGFHANGVRLANRQYVTVTGFQILRTEQHAIYLLNSSLDTVSHNRIRLAGAHGIAVEQGTGFMIDHNVVSESGDHGMNFIDNVSNSTVQDNESYRNARVVIRAANGFNLYNSSNNLIQRNSFHDNEDSGMEYAAGSNNNISLQNICWNNGDHGIDHINSLNTYQIGDEAVGNMNDGISVEGNSTGTQNWNCISVNNGLTTGRFDIYVDSTSTGGYQSNFNIIWNSTSQKPIKYDDVQYLSVATFAQATGLETQSIQGDPRFVDAAHGNLQVQAGSKAIDSGNSSLAHWPATDFTGHARVDDAATPNTGIGPITYADRGAFEFVRGGSVAVVDAPRVSAIGLGPAYPNPGRGTVAFALELPRAGALKWSVSDVQGRRVAFSAASLGAGRTVLRWSGADLAGKPVPAGIYTLKVDTGGETLTRRFTVIH